MWRLTVGLVLPRLLPSSLTRSYGFIPMAIDNRIGNHDIFSRLLNDRNVWIDGHINNRMASVVISQLLFLDSRNPTMPIKLYINSPGGVVTSGLAIYDTIQHIRPPVATLCIGEAASMASLLLASGAPGQRRALPNARILLHQPSAFGIGGEVVNIAIHSKEMSNMYKRLKSIYSKHTGLPVENIKQFFDRDTFLSPKEAKELGLIDEVLEHRPTTSPDAGIGFF